MLLSFSVPCADPLWQHQSRTGLTHSLFSPKFCPHVDWTRHSWFLMFPSSHENPPWMWGEVRGRVWPTLSIPEPAGRVLSWEEISTLQWNPKLQHWVQRRVKSCSQGSDYTGTTSSPVPSGQDVVRAFGGHSFKPPEEITPGIFI